MNEGELSGRLGLARLARRRRGGDHRPRLPARRARRLPAARLPRLDRRLGGDRPLGQGARAGTSPPRSCPHHLLLTDELAATYDPIYKVNPPLRTAADVEALRAGLADGTIDIVATDHAPHPHEDKDCEWAAAAFGMLGLETALSIVQQTMVDTGLLDWAGVAERMSVRPGPDRPGRRPRPPARGGRAGQRRARRPRRRAGWSTPPSRRRCRATRRTPGCELPGAVVATFLRGTPDRPRREAAPMTGRSPPVAASSRTAGPSAASPTAPPARPSARRCSPPA